jgi:hypothetical protein
VAGSAALNAGNEQTIRLQKRLPGVVRATLWGMFVSFQFLTIGAIHSGSDARVWELCMRMFFFSIVVVAASTWFSSVYAPVVMIVALRKFLTIDIGRSSDRQRESIEMRKRVKRNIVKLSIAGSVNFAIFAVILIICSVALLSPAALFGMRYGLPILTHFGAFLIALNSLMFYFGGVRHRTRTKSELIGRKSNAGRSHAENALAGASKHSGPGPSTLATVVPTSPRSALAARTSCSSRTRAAEAQRVAPPPRTTAALGRALPRRAMWRALRRA